jgi:hypothetical protein
MTTCEGPLWLGLGSELEAAATSVVGFVGVDDSMGWVACPLFLAGLRLARGFGLAAKVVIREPSASMIVEELYDLPDIDDRVFLISS